MQLNSGFPEGNNAKPCKTSLQYLNKVIKIRTKNRKILTHIIDSRLKKRFALSDQLKQRVDCRKLNAYIKRLADRFEYQRRKANERNVWFNYHIEQKEAAKRKLIKKNIVIKEIKPCTKGKTINRIDRDLEALYFLIEKHNVYSQIDKNI